MSTSESNLAQNARSHNASALDKKRHRNASTLNARRNANELRLYRKRAEKRRRVNQANAEGRARLDRANGKLTEARNGRQAVLASKSNYESRFGASFDETFDLLSRVKTESAKHPLHDFHPITHIPQGSFRSVVDQMVRRGYALDSVNAFELRHFTGTKHVDRTYFNVVFAKGRRSPWRVFIGLTSAQYRNSLDRWTGAGYRLHQINVYTVKGRVYYAPIFIKEDWLPPIFIRENRPQWFAYHGVDFSDHQRRFNDAIARGYRLVNRSVAESGGRFYVAALYDKRSMGAFEARDNLTSAQYQTYSERNTAAGKSLSYLDVVTVAGEPRFNAIWQTNRYRWCAALHNLTHDRYHKVFMKYRAAPLSVRILCGYSNHGTVNYAALWAR